MGDLIKSVIFSYGKNIIKLFRKIFHIQTVVSSSGKYFMIEDVELKMKNMGVRSACYGCLFLEKDWTCKYTERLKMPISCLDVVTPSNYQPKNK